MSEISPERLRELATRYRIAMIRLGATNNDFRACDVEPPTPEEREAFAL